MSVFEVSLVARTPAASGAPTLVEVDRLVVDSISYTETLNQPGSASLGCPIRSLSSAVKTRLAQLDQFPCEVRIYYDAVLQWAGEVQTLSVDGQTCTLGCVDLLGYTNRMGITVDQTFTFIDQFTVVKNLVDFWQNQSYGHFGIDTSTVGTCGVTIEYVYLHTELDNIGQTILNLGLSNTGFDIWVDPTTRKLKMAYPTRGSDLTGSVFMDARNIDSGSIAVSVAPGDLISDVSATGNGMTGANGTAFTGYATAETTAVLQNYGRCWASCTVNGVQDQTTLNNYAAYYASQRKAQLIQPGVTLVPNIGTGAIPGAFHPGDTIAYSFDAGLGLQSGNYRVSQITVTADNGGNTRMSVHFV